MYACASDSTREIRPLYSNQCLVEVTVIHAEAWSVVEALCDMYMYMKCWLYCMHVLEVGYITTVREKICTCTLTILAYQLSDSSVQVVILFGLYMYGLLYTPFTRHKNINVIIEGVVDHVHSSKCTSVVASCINGYCAFMGRFSAAFAYKSAWRWKAR